jgi:hypothetical protein
LLFLNARVIIGVKQLRIGQNSRDFFLLSNKFFNLRSLLSQLPFSKFLQVLLVKIVFDPFENTVKEFDEIDTHVSHYDHYKCCSLLYSIKVIPLVISQHHKYIQVG